MSEIVFEDGKNWRIRYTETGTRIRSEIPEPHTHPEGKDKTFELLLKIADKLGVMYIE